MDDDARPHPATPRGRLDLLRLVWHVAGDPDLPPARRRRARRQAVREYLLSPSPDLGRYAGTLLAGEESGPPAAGTPAPSRAAGLRATST